MNDTEINSVAINKMDEVGVFFATKLIQRFLFEAEKNLAKKPTNKLLRQERKACKDILCLLVKRTKEFGLTDIPENVIGPTAEFIQWYTFWKEWDKTLSAEEFSIVLNGLEKGIPAVHLYPSITWKQWLKKRKSADGGMEYT